MTPPRSGSSRSSAKVDIVVDEVRHWVLSGKYNPGQALPPRPEIEAYFGVSRMTLQKSLERLIEAGFLTAIPGTGTFVTESLPHLNQLGVLFPWRERAEKPWPIRWQRLRDLCESHGGSNSDMNVECFYQARGVMEDNDAYELEEALHEHRVAGLLVLQQAESAVKRFGIDKGAIPYAILSEGYGEPQPPALHLDLSAWLDSALNAIDAKGCTRPAMLVSPDESDYGRVVTAWNEQVKQKGFHTSPAWLQALNPTQPQWATHTLNMLFSGEGDQRPDTLIVAHESLVDAALRGLLEAGIRVGQDLTVLVRRDQPTQSGGILPVIELGFNMQSVLNEALTAFRAVRNGNDNHTTRILPPVECVDRLTLSNT